MKKGFTLIEIIAVVSLIAILGLIGTISITTILKNNRNEAYNLQINNIKESTKVWASKRIFILPSNEGDSISLKLVYLKQDGLVDKDIKNPKTEKLFSDDTVITIIKKNNAYEYSVLDLDSDTNPDINRPQIILNGESDINITGSINNTNTYTDPGAFGIINGNITQSITKEITSNGTVVSSIPLNSEKEYLITYKLTNNNKTETFIRKVSVKF